MAELTHPAPTTARLNLWDRLVDGEWPTRPADNDNAIDTGPTCGWLASVWSASTTPRGAINNRRRAGESSAALSHVKCTPFCSFPWCEFLFSDVFVFL